METKVGVAAKALSESSLYVRGMDVRLVEGEVARHAHVHLYGYGASYASGAEVVYLAGYRLLPYYIHYLPLNVLRQAFLKPVSYTHLTLPTICSV